MIVRHARISTPEGPRWGTEEGRGWLLWDAPPWDPSRRSSGEILGESASLLTPVLPSKIVCVGSNYRAHAAEMGRPIPEEPLLFLKPPSALLDPAGTIVLPPSSNRVDYEGEMGVVLGAVLKEANEEEALAGILGITCVNDVTARDLQRKDVQFTRGKGFDTFCPVGPILVTGLDSADLAISTWLDGQKVQDGRTSDMVFSVPRLISFISSIMTLFPGDLISTGTPAGVGPLLAGQWVEVRIEGVGALGNRVGGPGHSRAAP